jgi:tetratricopeptide (TPR) repeat protein
MAASVQKSLKEMETRFSSNESAAQRFEQAKVLRFQDELPAAGYEFAQLFNNATYAMQAYQNAGDIYKSLNNQLDAINCYRNAIKIEPKNANVHFRYALILEEIDNNEAAGEEYNLALQYGEKNPELLDKLEQLWLARTIEDPKNAQAFINLGTVLQKKGNFVDAKTQYERALALDPTDTTSALNLASLYVSNNNFAQVIPLYDNLLAKNTLVVKVLEYKAVAYE